MIGTLMLMDDGCVARVVQYKRDGSIWLRGADGRLYWVIDGDDPSMF
jgi:hypothetical protein